MSRALQPIVNLVVGATIVGVTMGVLGAIFGETDRPAAFGAMWAGVAFASGLWAGRFRTMRQAWAAQRLQLWQALCLVVWGIALLWAFAVLLQSGWVGRPMPALALIAAAASVGCYWLTITPGQRPQ